MFKWKCLIEPDEMGETIESTFNSSTSMKIHFELHESASTLNIFVYIPKMIGKDKFEKKVKKQMKIENTHARTRTLPRNTH